MVQSTKLHRQEKLKWLQDYKSSIGCVDCGEKHPATLDFHHEDPKEKVVGIRYAIKANWTKERLLVEMGKCVVLCSNCHRIRHWNEQSLEG